MTGFVENPSNLVILGDKGYVSENLIQKMKEQNTCLMALKRFNIKTDWPETFMVMHFQASAACGACISQLDEQLNAEKVLTKRFQGLCIHLLNKTFAYNLCLALKITFHEACKLGKIKQLTF